MKSYDIVVIGGGPGGYVAAIKAAKLGKKVALVEAKDLGGTCLNRGCIPSKTLLHQGEIIEKIKQAKEWGIETGAVTLSLPKMLVRKNEIIQKLRAGIHFLLKQGKIDVYFGYGKIERDRSVKIKMKETAEIVSVRTENIIVATGTEPTIPPVPGLAEAVVDTSDTIFELDSIPQSIVIIGGGVIGVEIACIFSSLQVDVTIVEMGKRILPQEDEEAAKVLAKALAAKGVHLLTNTKVTAVLQGDKQKVEIETSTGDREWLEGERILLAVGRTPNLSAVKELGLGMAGPFLKVDDQMRTSDPSIYAIGDVIGGWQLAHVASAEGLVAAANASGKVEIINRQVIPRCIYTQPEIASVGLTEQEAKEKGYSYKVVKVDLRANGKAMALGETTGFVKMIADPNYGEILGVTMVGPHVTEMIGEPAAFIHLEGTVDELKAMIHPHPTVSEALYEAAASWLGQGVHQP